MRLLVPDRQYFTGDLLVGVTAWANDRGSLADTCGLEKVVCHFEGSRIEIPAPSFQTFPDANGRPVTYFGWWAMLRRDGRSGHGRVYFEAIPRDASMQSRVIGPYQFSPQGALHDADLTVAANGPVVAGSSYRTLTAAIDWCRGAGRHNPRITITESETYGLPMPSFTYALEGRVTVRASVPAKIGYDSYTTDNAALLRPRTTQGMRFTGDAITFDMRFAAHLYCETGANAWLDGVRFTNSAGRAALWRKGRRPIPYIVNQEAFFTECRFDSIEGATVGAGLARGCTVEGCYSDIFTNACAVVDNHVTDHNSDEFTSELAAITVTYTGQSPTATLELAGSNDVSTRTFTARENGAVVGTFAVQMSEAAYTAGTNYTVENVVAWLNGLPGWSASALDTTRRASYLSKSGLQGAPFAATSVKDIVLTLATYMDLHADYYQQNDTGRPENVIVAGNTGVGIVCQDIFVTGASGAKDFVVVNNAFYNRETTGAFDNYENFLSQLYRKHGHVVLAHNSLSNQGLVLRKDIAYDPDGYCLVANNAVRELRFAGSIDPDVTVRANHAQRVATAGDYGGDTTHGGTRASLFGDAAGGDFSPAGDLLDYLRAPAVAYDMKRVRRAAASPAGAIA